MIIMCQWMMPRAGPTLHLGLLDAFLVLVESFSCAEVVDLIAFRSILAGELCQNRNLVVDVL